VLAPLARDVETLCAACCVSKGFCAATEAHPLWRDLFARTCLRPAPQNRASRTFARPLRCAQYGEHKRITRTKEPLRLASTLPPSCLVPRA
jgi:hypothetical protein